MDDYDYLEDGFDPNKLRVVDLRRILVDHQVPFGSLDKKRVLVELFSDHVASQASKLRKQRRAAAAAPSSAEGMEFMPGAEDAANRKALKKARSVLRARSKSRTRAAAAIEEESEAAPSAEASDERGNGRRDRMRTPSPASSRQTDLTSPRMGKRKLTARKTPLRAAAATTAAVIDFSDDEDERPATPRKSEREVLGTPRSKARAKTVAAVGKKSSLGLNVTPAKAHLGDADEEAAAKSPGVEKLTFDMPAQIDSPLQSPVAKAREYMSPVREGTAVPEGLRSARNPRSTSQVPTASPPPKKVKATEDQNRRWESGFFSDENPFQSGTEDRTPDRATRLRKKKTTKTRRHAASTAAVDTPDRPSVADEPFTFSQDVPTAPSEPAAPSPYAMRSPPLFRKSMVPIPIVFQDGPTTSTTQATATLEPETNPMPASPGSTATTTTVTTATVKATSPSPPRVRHRTSPAGGTTTAHHSYGEVRPRLLDSSPDVADSIPDPPAVHPALKRRFKKGGDDLYAGSALDRDGCGCLSLLFSVIVLLLAVAAGGLVWHRQESFRMGYCDAHEPAHPCLSVGYWADLTTEDVTQLPRDPARLHAVLQPSCIPCPHRAVCADGTIARCEEGFMLRPHPLANPVFPFPDQCIPDTVKLAKVEQVSDEIFRVLSERLGQLQCNWRQYDRFTKTQDEVSLVEAGGLPEDHLYAQVYSLKEPDVSNAEFAEVWQLALRNIKQWDDRVEYVLIETAPGQDTLYLISRVAHLPLRCRVKNALFHVLSTYLREVMGLLVVLTVVLFIRARYRRYVRESRLVEELVHAAVQRLVQQEHLHYVDPTQHPSNALSVTQLRDVLVTPAYAASAAARHRLWERVRKRVEHNANVRVRMTQVKGEPHRVWEWIGAAPAFGANGTNPPTHGGAVGSGDEMTAAGRAAQLLQQQSLGGLPLSGGNAAEGTAASADGGGAGTAGMSVEDGLLFAAGARQRR
ncbi:inner nuclear membrane protein enriched at telomere/subtelomere region [Tieghemiomyces parasiticus]|uniref:Inner nuclear membrane protein enriched at telomere/subtelomere region n=1 Tax=Tieghemiomyces parasiticus TaxID=78921 RepID=A0A9W8A0Y7_9FUNG|nr:inner nuclear membrane protein enriched at telomere/subtelomere region [Tieghemiomyces parasiticus]